MSVIIRPVREAVEHVINESLRTQVLSRPMIAEIVAAGINAIEADPIGYMTYCSTHADAGSAALAGVEDHIEQLRRAGQRASSWVHSRHINLAAQNGSVRSHGINEFLRSYIGNPTRPVPPRAPAHPEQLGLGAATTMGYQWLAYAKALDSWRKSANDPEMQRRQKLARETVATLLTDAFGPWLGH